MPSSARAHRFNSSTDSRCSQSALQSGATYAPCPQIEPSCMPPVDCQTCRPSSMSALVKTTVPSSASTFSGIGGAARKISPPAHSRTPKETTSSAPRHNHSFLVLLMTALPLGCRACCERPARDALMQVNRLSVAKHRCGEGFDLRPVEQFQLAPVDRHEALLLETLEDPADGFGCEAQVVGDVGARHRQLEAVGREPARREPPRHPDQEGRQA